MKYLIALLAWATVSCAQTPTSPVIVKALVLENQTALLGSVSSPVVLFTPSANGFYRITMHIAGVSSGVEVCAVSSPNQTENCAAVDAGDFKSDQSIAISFPLKSGEPIGYYTVLEPGGSVGTYDVTFVLERLL